MTTPTQNPPPILNLPIELLLSITDHLPPDAILALTLTTHHLNTTLQPLLRTLKSRPLTRCTRFAIERLLSTFPLQNQRRCIYCKNFYPATQFSSSSSPRCWVPAFDVSSGAPPRPEVLRLPDGMCAWHVGELCRVERTWERNRGKDDGWNCWVSEVRRMCMHGGCIEGWGDKEGGGKDEKKKKKWCECGCDSCGVREVRTYTRYLNNEVQCRKFEFRRDVGSGEKSQFEGEEIPGRLFVRESCDTEGHLPYGWTPRKFFINMPVRTELGCDKNDAVLQDLIRGVRLRGAALPYRGP